MQRPKDEKRKRILEVSARLFATLPFHEVRLDDVAARARIGKGTIYTYFANKDALYVGLLEDGMGELIARVGRLVAGEARDAKSPRAALRAIVREVVRFAAGHPHLFHLLRAGGALPSSRSLGDRRVELAALVERAIRGGVRAGSFKDAHPELTAEYLLGAVRGAMMLPTRRLDEDALAAHLADVLARGIERR